MNIAILSPISYHLPPVGYAPWEQVVYTLANGLVKKGHEVTVFTTLQSTGNFKTQGVLDYTIREVNHGFVHEIIHLTESAKLIRQEKFDIVHNHMNWYGLTTAEMIGIPYVTTLHGIEDNANDVFTYYKNSNYISISYAERKQSPSLNYIANVYNGIDFNFFMPSASRKNYLFVAARICREKGIHNAIQLSLESGIPLIIAGIVDDQKYYNEEILPFIDGKHIQYIGSLDRDAIQKYAAEAFAYVSMIEWEEPFGLSVAESIASGTPVIATRRGSMVELVKDGVSGILVDSVSEAVHRISELSVFDAIQCRDYGANLFSVDKMIDGYIDAYTAVI